MENNSTKLSKTRSVRLSPRLFDILQELKEIDEAGKSINSIIIECLLEGIKKIYSIDVYSNDYYTKKEKLKAKYGIAGEKED